jgi:hypothetical protein
LTGNTEIGEFDIPASGQKDVRGCIHE